ncbi:alkaline phosphatase [Endozoicomonas sp. Mp262]|uniref:alkaline phosphatase n=1 Tax=Endozoicomonas sp. Mp262 TaxID=2919499 RepID=UPI0021E0DE0B
MKPGKLAVALMASTALFLSGCSGLTQESETPVVEKTPKKVKNVIMMIGDGMGPQQVGLLETYARRAPNSIYAGKPTAIERIIEQGVLGISNTGPKDKIVVDSACSATQLATGYPTLSEVIGVGSEGEHLETILERAKVLGKATGLVSDTRLTHATPASFAAHRSHRSMENEIAEDMIRIAPDVMLSGGLRHFIPAAVNDKDKVYDQLVQQTGNSFSLSSKRKDNLNLLDTAKQSGFELAFNLEQMNAAKGDKLLGLFANSGMMDGIAYNATKNNPERTEPTLREMTEKALDVLSKKEEGFFLMVEGGQIDWAGHENDVGAMLHDLVKFDDAIDYVLDWAQKRDDTLVIVTADHETGSFGFSYSMKDVPEKVSLPEPGFGDEPYQPMFNFADLTLLDRIFAQSRSNKNIWGDFQSLPKAEQTPKRLADMMEQHHDFEVTEEMAARAMERTGNRFYVEGHSYLGAKTWPAVKSLFDSFYVYGDETHWNLMGHVLAEQQYVVWGTGTHTNTPVLVMAYGPEYAMKQFSKYLTHPEVGEMAKGFL